MSIVKCGGCPLGAEHRMGEEGEGMGPATAASRARGPAPGLGTLWNEALSGPDARGGGDAKPDSIVTLVADGAG